MKKSVVIFLIFVEIILLFIFQNIYSLFGGIEQTGISPEKSQRLMQSMKRMKQLFSVLSIMTAIFLISTAVYLGVLFKKSREEKESDGIPPLQTYLHELRDSQIELTDLVQQQQDQAFKRDELNKSIVNSINSAILFINPSQRVEIFNPVAEQIFSRSFAHAKHNRLEDVLEGFTPLVNFISDHENRKTSRDLEVGDDIFRVDIIPVARVGTLIIIKEITEERMRGEIDRRNRNFIQLGEMTAFLAHEVRNSLGVIYGYSKTIQGYLEKSEDHEPVEKIRRVNRELLSLSSMMESFLHFSKPVQPETREPVDLSLLLKTVAEEQKMSVELPTSPAVMETDPGLIKSVFANLFRNSAEAGADRIVIEILSEPYLEVRVQDNGRGITEGIEEKMWYPLFTTKKEGTGMGLAIVRKIVSSLGGDIQLVSSSGEGTLFKIVFYNPGHHSAGG